MKGGKQGQGLSVNAIILIVLGVIVLGVLVLGFTLGWSNFSSYFSTNNVQSVVTACNVACATQSQYDFNQVSRTLKTNEGTYIGTCRDLATGSRGQESGNDIPVSDSDKGKGYDKTLYKIATCPGL